MICVPSLSELKGYRHNIIKVPLETICDWLIASKRGPTMVPVDNALRRNIIFRFYMQVSNWVCLTRLSLFLDVEMKPLFARNTKKSCHTWKYNKAQCHDICPNIVHDFVYLQTNCPIWYQNIDTNHLASTKHTMNTIIYLPGKSVDGNAMANYELETGILKLNPKILFYNNLKKINEWIFNRV